MSRLTPEREAEIRSVFGNVGPTAAALDEVAALRTELAECEAECDAAEQRYETANAVAGDWHSRFEQAAEQLALVKADLQQRDDVVEQKIATILRLERELAERSK